MTLQRIDGCRGRSGSLSIQFSKAMLSDIEPTHEASEHKLLGQIRVGKTASILKPQPAL
jgi:hypothetical protein